MIANNRYAFWAYVGPKYVQVIARLVKTETGYQVYFSSENFKIVHEYVCQITRRASGKYGSWQLTVAFFTYKSKRHSLEQCIHAAFNALVQAGAISHE